MLNKLREVRPVDLAEAQAEVDYAIARSTVVDMNNQTLCDTPGFLLTNALHWDASRVFATWSYC